MSTSLVPSQRKEEAPSVTPSLQGDNEHMDVARSLLFFAAPRDAGILSDENTMNGTDKEAQDSTLASASSPSSRVRKVTEDTDTGNEALKEDSSEGLECRKGTALDERRSSVDEPAGLQQQPDDLCQEEGVSGYPTIMVYKDGKEEPYNGGRGFDDLLEFIETNLAVGCDVKKPETCSERAQKYISKWRAKEPAEIQKEMGRLGNIVKKDMAPNLKTWLRERLGILQDIAPASDEL